MPCGVNFVKYDRRTGYVRATFGLLFHDTRHDTQRWWLFEKVSNDKGLKEIVFSPLRATTRLPASSTGAGFFVPETPVNTGETMLMVAKRKKRMYLDGV